MYKKKGWYIHPVKYQPTTGMCSLANVDLFASRAVLRSKGPGGWTESRELIKQEGKGKAEGSPLAGG